MPAALLILAALTRLPGLQGPLLEVHSWRQTQTAYTAVLFARDGLDLLHSELPVLGPPWHVPFEFPLFQAVAAGLISLGIPADLSLRLSGLGWFLLTGLALWGLVRRLADPTVALSALVLFLFSPFGLLWSRTSMIEYMATFAAVAGAWAGLGWRAEGGYWRLAAAAIAFTVACLVKLPTGAAWMLPVLLARLPDRRREAGLLIALSAVPIALGVSWTMLADGVKAAGEATSFLTSGALAVFNFGTPESRLEPATWVTILTRLERYLFGGAALVLGLLAIRRASARGAWLGLIGAIVLPPLVLTGLYERHDYYLAALSPAVAALLALGWHDLWRRRPTNLPRSALAATALGYLALTIGPTVGYWGAAYDDSRDPDQVLPMANEIATATRPSDAIVVLGREWSSAVLYYADRRGLMLDPHLLGTALEVGLPYHEYRYVAATDSNRDPIAILARWRWVGVLGPHVYVVGDSPGELRPARLLAGYGLDLIVWAKTPTAPPMGLSLDCDGSPTMLRAGPDATIMAMEPSANPVARIRVGSTLAAVPVPTVLVVARSSETVEPDGSIALSCTGSGRLEIKAVFSAPAP